MALPYHQLALAIPTPDGALEGLLLYTNEASSEAGVLLCPPHPLLAGNLENNVVQAVAAHCAGRGLPVLLFNYRAVGRSFRPAPELPLFEYWHRLDTAGTFGAVIADARAAQAFSHRYMKRLHLIGYSFGAFIACHLIDEATASYTAITPPLMEHDFSPLANLAIPGLIVAAENEPLLADHHAFALPRTIRHQTLPATDHFFLGHEAALARTIGDFLSC